MVSASGVDTSTALQPAPSSMSKEELLCKNPSSIGIVTTITDNLAPQRLVCLVKRQIPGLVPR